MAQVSYAGQALADLERIVDFLRDEEPELAQRVVLRVSEAVSILREHPLIGRRVEADLRELVISSGRTGYVALYRYLEREEVVLVLALRHQRESGYADT